MKALCCLYGFLLEGSFGPDLLVVSTQFLSPYPVIFVVMGLLGLILNHLVSLHIVSPGCGLIYVIGVCAVGYDGYYAKRLALGLVSISWLCFYINIIRVDWGKPRGLCPACSRCYYWPVRSLCSSVHNLSYLV
jgi:hypothetical protein